MSVTNESVRDDGPMMVDGDMKHHVVARDPEHSEAARKFRTLSSVAARVVGASLVAGVAVEMVATVPAEAYDGAAAGAYADQYAINPNSAYPLWNPDCTDFVSQALAAGSQPPIMTGAQYDSTADWWDFPNSDGVLIYTLGRQASFSATVAADLKTFMGQSGFGTSEGWTSGTNAPPFTPNSVVTGDLVFYDWGQGEGISHVAMQAPGNGYDSYGWYGNWVDDHSNNHKHEHYALEGTNSYWQYTTIHFVHVNV